ncbi:hypothetical protein D3C71_2025140 [compost metagenome]
MSRGTNKRNPAVGIGVGGRNTVTISMPRSENLAATSPLTSVEMKTSDQRPGLGYSIRPAFLNDDDCSCRTVWKICFSDL